MLDLRVEKLTTSPGALREGVLYDLLGRIRHEDVRDRTIRWFQKRYHVNVEHAARVELSALKLLDEVSGHWDLDLEWADQMLRWTARLHELGLAVSHTGYHRHGAYLVQNSHMAGFSRDEQSILGALIGSQRRKFRVPQLDHVGPKHHRFIAQLSVLFRLARCINRAHDENVPPFSLKVHADELELVFPAGWLKQHPLTLTVLEVEAGYLAVAGYQLRLARAE